VGNREHQRQVGVDREEGAGEQTPARHERRDAASRAEHASGQQVPQCRHQYPDGGGRRDAGDGGDVLRRPAQRGDPDRGEHGRHDAAAAGH